MRSRTSPPKNGMLATGEGSIYPFNWRYRPIAVFRAADKQTFAGIAFRPPKRVLIEIWRHHYNDVRPRSSLDYRAPNEFRRRHESTHQGAILK